jgi:hypothetical protein
MSMQSLWTLALNKYFILHLLQLFSAQITYMVTSIESPKFEMYSK